MKIIAIALASTLALASLAQAQETNATINHRKAEQQQRIAQGVKSGQMTAGETAHIERQESAINHEERNMRTQDNGHLTKADRAAIQKQQNQENRRIYRDKHNTAKQ